MQTRDRILEMGEELFRTRGFNAFSYYDLAEALCVRPPAIHYHFRTKDDLAIAILERERARFASFVAEMHAIDDPVVALKQFAASFAAHAQAHHICLIGASGSDYHTFGEAVHVHVRGMAEEILTWLTATLREGRRRGVVVFAGSAPTRAMMLAATLAASLHLARILGPEAHQRIARQLMLDLTTTTPSRKTHA